MLDGCLTTFSPGLLIGDEAVKARALTREALPRPLVLQGIGCFSFVIFNAALGRAMQVISFVGLPRPCPNAGITSVSSGFCEGCMSMNASSHVAILNNPLNVSSPTQLIRKRPENSCGISAKY